MEQKMSSHLLALFLCNCMGFYFVVSKSLMAILTPVQLMLLRFTLAYVALWIIHPNGILLAGRMAIFTYIFSNTLYCWAEVTALTITQASNGKHTCFYLSNYYCCNFSCFAKR